MQTTKLFYLNIDIAIDLLKNIPLDTQRDLYWPAVYNYLNTIEGGGKLKPIEIYDGKLVNGQHRVMAFILSRKKEYFFRIN